jgi:NAD+ kinase
MSRPRILVLVKRTSYRYFVEEEHDARVKGLLAKGDPTVRRLRRSHEDHEATVAELRAALAKLDTRPEFALGARTRVEGTFDLVVTVGGDGTLLGASHGLGPDTPILGINSAPDHSVGFFCAARKGAVMTGLAAALDGSMKRTVLSRMRVELNGECLHKRVLNDALFSHEIPAATSRYILIVTNAQGGDEQEEQRSSGLWVGPAAGSTAAQRSAGGKILPLTSKKVQYVVREPYTPIGTPLRLPQGTVDDGGQVTLRSKMKQAKIFLDGHHIVHEVAIGDVITMKHSDETLTVLGLTRRNGSPAR